MLTRSPPPRTRSTDRVILLRQEAPRQPAVGAPCNGCGVCCVAEPCPLGMLISRRNHGRCRALRWDEALHLYRCGMVSQPERYLPWLPPWGRVAASRWAKRWISSASGCDATLVRSQSPD